MPLPAEPDGKLAYDLIPMDSARGYCYGEHCRQAALAIDEYRAFLHRFSGFRKDVVHAILSNGCPFADGGHFLKLLRSLDAALPSLLTSLRTALPGLQATCVVPSRSAPRQYKGNWDQAKMLMETRKAWEAQVLAGMRKGEAV